MAQGCMFCFPSGTVPSRGENNALIASIHSIQRYALNRKGVVGSLYDVWTNNLLTALPVNEDLLLQRDVKEIPNCKLIKINDENRDSVLEMIGIDNDLRVSIILDTVPVNEGTIMLHAYDLPTDRTLRIIDYFNVDHEEYLSNNIQMIRKSLPDTQPNDNATHIITGVRRGIDFVILLEFPENANNDDIDSVLEKLCKYFVKPEADFLTEEEQQKINCLKLTIFSSMEGIRLLTENKELTTTCQNIRQYIYQNTNNAPLSYTMHPVKCIYYDNSFNRTVYNPLDSFIARSIEEKLNPFSKRVKRIERLFQEISSQLSSTNKSLIEKPTGDLYQIQNMYRKIQQTVTAKVTAFHQGSFIGSLFHGELNDTHFKTLDSELNRLETTIFELQKKAHYLTDLKTDRQVKDFSKTDCRATNSDQRYPESIIKPVQSSRQFPTASSIVGPREINILLIGETGVGKSTFINAFVNYLAFDSFEQAENGDPIVLIPVSFLITFGDQFEEKQITFGQTDSNEDHNDLNQSVTQCCRSYIFTNRNSIKLRIIDTPGIGDTRGVEQDNKNIEHILSYTSNLSHLNAICFLFKPNTTRLHVLFRSCFMQLFSFLGPEARENIIFCFTNARATFYAPGDTAKLLKTMLNELPKDHIPAFAKENTFCFDSESFRYLAMIKAGYKLPFDNNEKINFQESWRISVNESVRLLDYIEFRPKYPMNKWRSMKQAQMMITSLVRPIFETICNALRNLVLWELGNKKYTIELKAEPISSPAWSCTAVPFTITQINNISIVTHSIQNYQLSNKCPKCDRALNDHLSILYDLQYHLSGTKGARFSEETKSMKNRLLYGSILLSKFLLHIDGASPNPFLIWFDLFIKEQEYIYSEEPSSDSNAKLRDMLYEEKQKYEESLKYKEFDDDRIELDVVYNCIDEILKYPIILQQMKAMKASQMEAMKNNEHDISSQYPNINSFL